MHTLKTEIMLKDMSALRRHEFIAVEDYLAGELASPVKHEYVAGRVYAMAGGSVRHHLIAGNLFGVLFMRLRGQPCTPFSSDLKVRMQFASHTRFYYPDATVVCGEVDPDLSYVDNPSLVAEVLSDSTRRIDEGEKREGYLSLGSLNAYLLVEQDLPLITLWRRTETGFASEVYEGLATSVPLPELGCELPLAEIYEGVVFPAKPPTDAENSDD
jgi:Uma2 family endonuclease